MTREIPLSRNQVALVDDDEYERLIRYAWMCSPQGYAYARVGKYSIYMHRLIMQTPKGLETDHINRQRLDNRKENLRNVTRAVNLQNRGPRQVGNYPLPSTGRRAHKKQPVPKTPRIRRYGRWPAELRPETIQEIKSLAKTTGVSAQEMTRRLIRFGLQDTQFNPLAID